MIKLLLYYKIRLEKEVLLMNIKQKIDTVAAILFLLIGCFLLLCPLMQFTQINLLFILTMLFYTIINFGKFLLTKEQNRRGSLYSSLAALIVMIIAIFFQINESVLNLTILLFIWITFESLIKLKRADYFHDRKSKFWILEMIYLILFIVFGIFTGINLNQTIDIQILLLGYFFFFHGVLEFINPIIFYFTKERMKK